MVQNLRLAAHSANHPACFHFAWRFSVVLLGDFGRLHVSRRLEQERSKHLSASTQGSRLLPTVHIRIPAEVKYGGREEEIPRCACLPKSRQ